MLFDIRTVVAALLGCYGVVLVAAGLSHRRAADLAPAGGWNMNLWAGIGMLVVAAVLLLWMRLRPVRPADTESGE
ncbi:hypothetical protein [Nocardia stercoris]|uniref:Uncharacterized protein n=1 Tax=Nocardia stercoris TaxID=2483361 RepID=A0A3M2LCD9_9NOCA|nr:hypothetical protein [Nocardia stercoris]RMI35222.1 hypothetical protein EBN03_02730 [Nocardia stercoris]